MDKRYVSELKEGNSDLRKYIKKHAHKEIKLYRRYSFIALLVSICSFGFSIYSSPDLFGIILGILFGTLSSLFSFDNYRKASNPFNSYCPSTKTYIFGTEELLGATVEGEFRKFSEVIPPEEEQGVGFQPVNTEGLCSNSAFISSSLDDLLTLSTNIQLEIDNNEKLDFVSQHTEKKRTQLKYLVARVGSSEYRTTNGKKICFQSSIIELMESIQGKGKVSVAEVGYFDGLITNEAFRSKLYEYKNMNDRQKKRNPVVTYDLTNNFPLFRNNNNQFYLETQPCFVASRHIGITTIAITIDKQIVFFEQDEFNLIGGGLLVSSGSGSADFSDINDSENTTNLITILKYSMARELVEEGNLYRDLPSNTKRTKTLDIAKNTMITGFFRWVDRVGKPEFIGISKLDVHSNDIEGDNFEVIKEDSLTHIFKKEIKKLTDFTEFKNVLLTNKSIYQLNLSFFIALDRLVTIAGYSNSSDIKEKKVFERVNNFLFQ